jgi:serine protease Do
VILEVNRKGVSGARDVAELVRRAKEGQILLRVWSRGGSRFIVVEPEKTNTPREQNSRSR